MKNKPKILCFDIETAHNIIAAFQLFNKYSPNPYENILQERFIICASWKWLGENKVYSVQVTPAEAKVGDDSRVVKRLQEVLSSADAVVAHYGDNFDIPYVHARCLYHGIAPIPSDLIQIDTKKIASKKFLFNANRLDYLGQFLKVGKKIKTENGLWLECLHGNEDAIEKMVKYNQQDVRLLEKVYTRLKPYVPSQINYRLFGSTEACSSCGSNSLQSRGYSYTKSRKYRRYQCTNCGGWTRASKAEKL